MSEFAYIDWLRKQTPPDPRVLIGPGDDAAALVVDVARPLLVTTDMLLEGSCFVLESAGARAVGRKALAVNLSDIAAMAGIPLGAVVSVALPRQGGRRVAEELYLGLREVADRFHTPLVGGDTNSWNGLLAISVTVIGQATGRGPVRRSGALPGDWIFVTGPLGGSILGRHLDALPRIDEALRLHEIVNLHAMIDISDGLAADLHHICEESRCGAVLRAESIPIHADARRLSAQDGRPALEHALADGEDFELAFTLSPEDGRRLVASQPITGISLSHIGECVESGIWIAEGGQRRELEAKGYVHQLS